MVGDSLHLLPGPAPARFLAGRDRDFAQQRRQTDFALACFPFEKLTGGVVEAHGNWRGQWPLHV